MNHQEVDWIGRYKCGSKYQPGDTFPCRLLEADLQKGSLKFSRRLTLPSPIGNYRIGQTVSGVVYAVYAPAKKLGLIVDNCIYAYLDKRHVYWEREITLDECPALGSLVTAVVCAISSQTATLFLSLLGDPPYAAGEQIKGAKVDKIDGKGNIHLKSPEGVSLFIAATDKESMNRLPMKYLGKRYITKGENLDVTVESVDTERACFVVSLR